MCNRQEKAQKEGLIRELSDHLITIKKLKLFDQDEIIDGKSVSILDNAISSSMSNRSNS